MTTPAAPSGGAPPGNDSGTGEVVPGQRARRPRRLWPALGASGLALALAMGLLAVGRAGGRDGIGEDPSATSRAGPAPGRLLPRQGSGPPAPSFRLPAFGGEGVVTNADFAGVPLVVNFWASWCPFCIDEMPDFEAVHIRLGEAVAFLGVDLQDDPRLAAKLIRRTGVTYPMAEDREGRFFAEVRGLGMPTTLLITADGRLARQVTGPLDAAGLGRLIMEFLVEGGPVSSGVAALPEPT